MKPQRISRSEHKRRTTALQDLGVALIGLTEGQLRQMDLEPRLLEAVLHAKTITSNGAIRRQRQYIGALMRDTDPEPIRRVLYGINRRRRMNAADHNQVHQWREQLVAGDQGLAERIAADYPACDAAHLATLIRNAREERDLTRKPHHSRLLFRYLRQLVCGTEDPITTKSSCQEPGDP